MKQRTGLLIFRFLQMKHPVLLGTPTILLITGFFEVKQNSMLDSDEQLHDLSKKKRRGEQAERDQVPCCRCMPGVALAHCEVEVWC